MRGRRPRLIERSFEFHGPDQQPRHVAAIGVLAANADFTNAREVIDIVFFDVRTGEIANRAFKHKARELVARRQFAAPRLRANVLPQSRRSPRCTPSRGKRFSNVQKPLRNFMLGGKRSQHNPIQIPYAGVFGVELAARQLPA